jgi:hypothetical protein
MGFQLPAPGFQQLLAVLLAAAGSWPAASCWALGYMGFLVLGFLDLGFLICVLLNHVLDCSASTR